MPVLRLARKIRKRSGNLAFRIACRGVLDTPPLSPSQTGTLIVSLVSHIDLMLYLVAIKSFYPKISGGEIIIIDDGSLTKRDRRIVEEHVRPSEVVSVDDIRIEGTPQDVSWKRLAFITDRLSDRYVVQLDSDTVTFRDLPEVETAISKGENFILGTSTGQSIGAMADAVERWQGLPEIDAPQAVAERNFDQLDGWESLRYVRGNAAFTGFAQKSFSRNDIFSFSSRMEKIAGPAWHRWGSEQVAVNYLVSNAGKTVVLPYPGYTGYYPKNDIPFDEARFIHFTGLNRYSNGYYRRAAARVISGLVPAP